jgi:hypothetical protein
MDLLFTNPLVYKTVNIGNVREVIEAVRYWPKQTKE